MIGIIQRRPHQIIHRRIDDQKLLGTVRLPVEHASEQSARRPHDGTARLEQKMHFQSAQRTQQRSRIFRKLPRRSRAATDPRSRCPGRLRRPRIECDGPSSCSTRTSSATRSMVSANGCTSVICEPMCTLTPAILRYFVPEPAHRASWPCRSERRICADADRSRCKDEFWPERRD